MTGFIKHSHDRIISLLEEDWVHKNTHDRITSLLEDDWVHKNILMGGHESVFMNTVIF
jgi:hypothetical protein